MLTCKEFRETRLRRGERGSLLVELLISITILAVGIGGVMVLIVSAVKTDGKASNDTTSTMVAEHVLEQISAQPANAVTLLQLTDCAGTAWNIDTAGSLQGAGSAGGSGGNGASLTANGIVDWTQAYGAIPANYAMKYVACGAGAKQTTYDVRWDVITMSAYSRMVVVSARPASSTSVGGLQFIIPANLRTVAGM
jgi:type II secretory pathway pseudopilin PulG